MNEGAVAAAVSATEAAWSLPAVAGNFLALEYVEKTLRFRRKRKLNLVIPLRSSV